MAAKFVRKLGRSFTFPQSKKDYNCELIKLKKYELNKEIDRRKSFIDNNWNNEHVKFEDLALLGFYFYKKPDHVRCYFCDVDLSEFDANDDVLKEHFKFSPNCPLMRRRETDNVALDPEDLDRTLPPANFDECGSTSSRRKKSRVEDDVAHPKFSLPSARLSSFATWPKGIKQRPQELTEAGFFYSGQSDIVVCFSCGVYVGQWEEDDNPWVEHKKLMIKDCDFLKLNQELLKLNEQNYEKLMKLKDSAPIDTIKTEVEEPEVDFETACKVCLSRKSSIVFLPCQHVAVCGQCIYGIGKKCPICRAKIEKTIPLFYS